VRRISEIHFNFDVLQCLFPRPSERYTTTKMTVSSWYRLACDEESNILLREKHSKNIKCVISSAVETCSTVCWLQFVPNNSNPLKRRL